MKLNLSQNEARLNGLKPRSQVQAIQNGLCATFNGGELLFSLVSGNWLMGGLDGVKLAANAFMAVNTISNASQAEELLKQVILKIAKCDKLLDLCQKTRKDIKNLLLLIQKKLEELEKHEDFEKQQKKTKRVKKTRRVKKILCLLISIVGLGCICTIYKTT